MIISTETLKSLCDKILPAVDNNLIDPLQLTTSLEIATGQDELLINVTNREYYVKASLPLHIEEELHVVINATLFLKLISQMTTPDVELVIDENSLKIKGNGTYNLPLIFDNDKLLELPKIIIHNVTCEMNVKNSYLQSIVKFNSKEIKKGNIVSPVQKMYYVDELGAITFTSGACVNSFNLDQPIRLLLSEKLVKLFKLFDSEEVSLKYGIDQIGNSKILQPKVELSNGKITISALLSSDDSLIKSVPTASIRKLADQVYTYNVELSKGSLLAAINRLSLFKSSSNANIYNFIFNKDSLIIKDDVGKNEEKIDYLNEANVTETYTAKLDLMDLKLTMETYDEPYFNLCFGNKTNIMTIRGNIKNIIPEIEMVR